MRGTKAVMKAGGVIHGGAVRHPFALLDAPTQQGLMALVKALDPIALRWGK